MRFLVRAERTEKNLQSVVRENYTFVMCSRKFGNNVENKKGT